MSGIKNADTVLELTPHHWQWHERAAVRAATLCAIEFNFPRMEQHLRELPREALADLRYALDVMHPIVRAMGEQPVPCPRCGHPESDHNVVSGVFCSAS